MILSCFTQLFLLQKEQFFRTIGKVGISTIESMYLEKLKIQGFKSFANKTVLEFTHATENDKGITAIVGPNGSGKSNVADAIRWVLGEQSMKTMRAKKSEDVIFSGSSKKARLGLAEVSLYLRNQKNDTFAESELAEENEEQKEFFSQLLALPEIVLTRRLYRNGDSDYLLNNKKARLIDVVMLLAKARFGQKTYSVIGQGMIDHILVATLAERKEFFDEAVGVKPLQIKRDQSLLKLKNTAENLQQVELLLTEIEPRLKSLTRQVKRLEKREEVEKELHEKQKTYYHYFWHEHTAAMEKEQQAVKEKNHIQLEVQDAIKKLASKLGSLEQESSVSEQFSELQENYQKLLTKKNTLLKEDGRLKTDRERALLKEGKSDVVWFERREDEMQAKIKELIKDRQQVQQQKKEQENSIAQFEKDAQKQEDRYQEAVKQLKALQQEVRLTVPEFAQELEKVFIEQEQTLSVLFETNDLQEVRQAADTLQKQLHAMRKLHTTVQRASQDTASKERDDMENAYEDVGKEREKSIAVVGEAKLQYKLLEEKEQLLACAVEQTEHELTQVKKEITFNKQRENTNSSVVTTAALEEEQQKVQTALEHLAKNIVQVEQELRVLTEKESEKKKDFFVLQKGLSEQQQQLQAVMAERNTHEVSLARSETKREDLEKEIGEELPRDARKDVMQGHASTADEAMVEQLGMRIHQLKNQLEVIGGIDEEVVAEHKEIDERYTFLHTQVADLTKARAHLEKTVEELDNLIQKQFTVGFTHINREFQQYFTKLFDGGVAKLVHVHERRKKKQDENEEGEEKSTKKEKEKVFEGIEIQVTPPGKKLKDISALSGGERALTSIALICAIISTNPSPFVVLDEVDAALDESNSERFADILKHLSHKSQFITITHNRATMRRARLLYGVTMGDDSISQLLSVKLEEAEGERV